MRYFYVLILFLSSYWSHAQSFDTVMVHFDINATKISDSGRSTLMTLVKKLQVDTQNKILIYGLADYLGTADDNLKLSTARAQQVAQFLKSQHLAANRILVEKGLGQNMIENEGEHGNYLHRNAMILVTNRAKKVSRNQSPIQSAIIADRLEDMVQLTNVNETFVLNDIHFVIHKVELAPSSMPKLQELLQVMNRNPKLSISIEGHICCNQLEGYDPNSEPYKLSIRRAKKIYDYLILNNVAPSRLIYKGFGRSKPIFEEEDTKEQMDANRRVEIRITAK